MKPEVPPSVGPITRRRALAKGGSAATLAAAHALAPFVLSGCRKALLPKGSSIKVGSLHSQTGVMAMSDASLRDMELMAFEEINAAGGVLGYPLEPVVVDGRSRYEDVFPEMARKLLESDRVAAVFGCWTSASRKAVLPVFEELNGLLFYPLQYEGNECSRNIVYGGSTPNQQTLPAIDWLLSSDGGSRRRFYLVGSDYIYPRTANYIVSKYLRPTGAEVVGEEYAALGDRDLGDVVARIEAAKPDIVLNTINGESNISFYRELFSRGLTAEKLPVLATSVGEVELRSLLPEWVERQLSAWPYFQSIDLPSNVAFVDRVKAELGWDRVVNDPMATAYSLVYLWKHAVEKAESLAVDDVRQALASGITFDAPGGAIKIDPKTLHTYRRLRIGRIRPDRQFDVVYESPQWIAPDPYPEIAFPGWSCDWTRDGVTQGEPVSIPKIS